jgi:hypothetical protein
VNRALIALAAVVAALAVSIPGAFGRTLEASAPTATPGITSSTITIGGTIQQILENLQFAADERLIEPLWRMQVLVDRASGRVRRLFSSRPALESAPLVPMLFRCERDRVDQ